MKAKKWVWAASLSLSLGRAAAEEKKDAGEGAVVEIGAAASRNLKGRTSSFGPTVAVEVSLIENWLELEAGVTSSFVRHTTEWTSDLLFKKPWTISRTIEFMAGIGPEWIHSRQSGAATNAAAGEAVLEGKDIPKTGRRLIQADSNGVYAAGYVLFARQRTLMAEPFDASSLQLAGSAFPVAEEVDFIANASQSQFSASRAGALAYTSGAAIATVNVQLGADGTMMSVEVRNAFRSNPTEFDFDVPKALFDTHLTGFSANTRFDVAGDGRFLIPVPLAAGGASSVPITMVFNWQAGLKK